MNSWSRLLQITYFLSLILVSNILSLLISYPQKIAAQFAAQVAAAAAGTAPTMTTTVTTVTTSSSKTVLSISSDIAVNTSSNDLKDDVAEVKESASLPVLLPSAEDEAVVKQETDV